MLEKVTAVFDFLKLLIQNARFAATPSDLFFKELFFVLLVLAGLLSLALQAVQAALDLGDHVVQAREVGLGGFDLPKRLFFTGFVFCDACGFFDQKAALFRLRVHDLADLALLDHGVAFGANPGVHEEFLNVFQAGGNAVDEVLAVSVAVHAPSDGNFFRFQGRARVFGAGACGAVLGVGNHLFQHHGRFSHAQGRVAGRAVENQVVGTRASHVLVGLLAHDPEKGVHDVRLAAAVGPDDAGNRVVKVNDRFVFERLEALNFQSLDAHS